MFALAFSLAIAAAWAEGPGTRLRTTPEVPPPAEVSRPPEPAQRIKECEALRADARERCLRQNREPDAERHTIGPEATGMGHGASRGNSGTSSATMGATAPR
jgi:hypothetical protein